MTQTNMSSPRKRKSEILERLDKEKDPLETQRTRVKILLASRIITALKQKGLNKISFAKGMNKKPSVITRWLSGTHNFTTDTLVDIQHLLNIKLLEIYEIPLLTNEEYTYQANNSTKYTGTIIHEEVADLTKFSAGVSFQKHNLKKEASTLLS